MNLTSHIIEIQFICRLKLSCSHIYFLLNNTFYVSMGMGNRVELNLVVLYTVSFVRPLERGGIKRRKVK